MSNTNSNSVLFTATHMKPQSQVPEPLCSPGGGRKKTIFTQSETNHWVQPMVQWAR